MLHFGDYIAIFLLEGSLKLTFLIMCSPPFSFKLCFLRSLQRALDRRLYLILYGNTFGAPGGKPVWHFPEKVYKSEETLRKVILLFPCLVLCFLV